MLCWNFPPAVGGIEAVAFHLWEELRHHDCAVEGIARHSSTPASEEGISRPEKAGLVTYLGFSFFAARRILKKKSTRLIVCPGIVDAPVAWLLSKWYKVPFVLLAHGTDIMREGSVYRKVTRFFFRAAEGVAVNSQNTRELLEAIGVDPQRIRIIHPGVCIPEAQPETIPPEIESLLAKKNGPILMTVGRVIRRKGIGEFIKHVMPALVEKNPDLHYVVVGADASDSLAHHEKLLDQLQAQTRELGLDGNVSFTGKVSDAALQTLLSKADLLVFPVIPIPGDVEGFGIVVLEGAVQGVPAVASRIGGIPDAVEEGQSGLLVEPENWTEMTQTVQELISDPEKRIEMGRRAAERAKNEFRWEAIGRKYIRFFEDCSSHD